MDVLIGLIWFNRRYVDDFDIFESPESAHSFREYFVSKYQHIDFSVEHKYIGTLSLLNVRICCEKGTFVISVYRKLIFSEVFTNYESFNPTYQKRQVKALRSVL